MPPSLTKYPPHITALRYGTTVLLSYEVGAIIFDRENIPTLSKLAGRHRWVGPSLVAALVVHLWWPTKLLIDDED